MKILNAGSKESINIKGAFLEVVSDMLSSVGVIIAGIVILATGWRYIDPIMSALIGLFILPRTFRLLKESVNILLEAVPANIDYGAVEKCISEREGVASLHDLHIWTITSGVTALSVHVIMQRETPLTQISEFVQNIKEYLESEFKIGHTTIEVHIENENHKKNIV